VIEAVELQVGELWLRPPSVDEAADALAMLHDPDVVRWNPAPDVVDLDEARAWCERGADWSTGEHATFSVLDLGTTRLLANISLHEIAPDRAKADIGYRVAPWARRQGVATAAVLAVTTWATTALELRRIELIHHVENVGSCLVARGCGYGFERLTDQGEHVHAVVVPPVL